MSVIRRFAVGLIRLYQRTLSRALPPSCRFTPSCSEYAAQAIEAFGLLRGGWMAVRRICRCHPWSEGGEDPVPGRERDSREHLTSHADESERR
ncbi:MAG: membrane protein insertion efficiency factor YidD [Armatimonadota bacterium]|jgi:putative membrane protein insertion efficiency factor